jgi:pimeloyl-ACP methyl ester carboxylesterase
MTRRRLVTAAILFSLTATAAPGRSADKPTRHSFDSNGVKIAYSSQGAGECVVLIHGWLGNSLLNWEPPGISAALAKDHRVIAMDVRGHGESDKPLKDEDYGPQLVEDVARLLDHLKLEKAHIVGYSMGGVITANFLVKHPERVLSGTLGGMGWLKKGGLGELGFAQIGKKDAAPNAQAVCGRSLAKLSLTEAEIKSITAPVKVLVGDKDDLIQKLYVEPLKTVRKDWSIAEIPYANHITCIVKPQFQDELVSWIKKNSE